MMDILSKITVSEVLLLFVLLFVLPGMGYLVMRLRKYEALFGFFPDDKKKAKKPEPAAAETAAKTEPAAGVPDDVFPYRSKAFLSPADEACLGAMREALGDEVEVFPKVALWEFVESTDKEAGYLQRLHGRDVDFLVCDRKTGRPLTAVAYNPAKGRPAGPVDELKKICDAAEANIVFIDMAEEYDAKSLKEALGIPELDI